MFGMVIITLNFQLSILNLNKLSTFNWIFTSSLSHTLFS